MKYYANSIIVIREKQVLALKLSQNLIDKAKPFSQLSKDEIPFITNGKASLSNLKNADPVYLTALHLFVTDHFLEKKIIRKNANNQNKSMIFLMRDKIIIPKDKASIYIDNSNLSVDTFVSYVKDIFDVDCSKYEFISQEDPTDVIREPEVKVEPTAVESDGELYSYVGIATDTKKRRKVKYTNDKNRMYRLTKDGFTDVIFLELPSKMNKNDALHYLKSNIIDHGLD